MAAPAAEVTAAKAADLSLPALRREFVPAVPCRPPTRYETYRYELEMVPEVIVSPGQDIYDAGSAMLSYKTEEDGGTECFQATPPEMPGYNYYPGQVRDLALLGDRRVMPLVVANCYALEANGTSTGGKFSFKPSELVYVFLTEPMKNPSDSEIYAEILGKVDDAAKASLVRDIVQLYRRGG